MVNKSIGWFREDKLPIRVKEILNNYLTSKIDDESLKFNLKIAINVIDFQTKFKKSLV